MSGSEVGLLLGGRWRVVSALGAGGQGHTFVARDEKSPGVGERLVVVKRLRLGEAGWKRFDLFEREAGVLARLDHPGIPRFLGRVDGEGGTFWLVMERAPGDTLRALGARRRLDEDELRDVMGRVLDILVYLHAQKPPVVHRDIKPANIVRAEGGAVKLVDFGGVRAALADDEGGGSTVVGTYGYMAPEQLHGEASPRTDLYGLGATIVALAAGVEPDKVPRRGLKMDLRRHLPKMSGDLRALLERMTEPDPEKRPGSAEEVKELLGAPRRSLAKVEPEPEPEPEPVEQAPEDDWVAELDELRVPPVIRSVLRIAFGLIGIAGHLSLALISLILVPVVFSVARAFTGKDGDARLRETQSRVQGSLRDARRNFRALQRRAFTPTRRLAAGRERPRLPKRRG